MVFSNRFVGKVLIVALFLCSAYFKYQDFSSSVESASSGFTKVGLDVTKYGLPADSIKYLVGLAAFLEAGGALAILTGGDNCGTVMLLLFLIPTTAIMHWPIKADGTADAGNFIEVMKNMAIAGGLIVLRSSMVRKIKHD